MPGSKASVIPTTVSVVPSAKEPHHAVYYTAERGYYVQPPDNSGSTVVVEKEKPVWTPCLWCLIAILTILLVALIIGLIIFFTWGQSYLVATSIKTAEPLVAQSQQLFNHRDLMTVNEVYEYTQKGDAKLCLLDSAYFAADPYGLYKSEHLASAAHYNIDMVTKDLKTKRRELVAPPEFQEYTRKAGVKRDCLVVIYDHSDDKKSLMSATYVWWLFKSFGYERVAIMNGGIAKWKSHVPTYPVTGNPSAIAYGDMLAAWNPAHLIQIDDVLSHVQKDLGSKTKSVQLVDARAEDQFLGATKIGNPKFGGHIINAVNFPVDRIISETDGTLKDLATVKSLWLNAGLELDKLTIVYCNTGLQSSTLVFALKQLGVPVKLYDGSWVEWSFKAPSDLSVAATTK